MHQHNQSDDVLRTIFDTINDGLVLLDHTTTIQAINHTMATILGYTSPADLINQSWEYACRIVQNVNPDQSTNPLCLCVFTTLHDTQPRTLREHIVLPDGRNHILDIVVHPHIKPSPTADDSQQQELCQIVLHVTDVTERLRMEALLVETERFDTMRRMTSIVAHEINTPLQTILGTLERLPQVSSEKQALFLTLAKQEIQRIGTMLHQLTDTYRPSSENHRTLDLAHLVERVVLLMTGRLNTFAIEIAYTCAPDLPFVYGRSDELTQVILNVCLNAIEAMPNGGCMTILLNGRIAQDEARSDTQPWVVLTIADTGPGISPDVQTRIFEPFFTTKQTGTGLGLFVSQRIIANHGGIITVHSSPQKGCTVSIELPGR